MPLRTVELAGTPLAMGRQYGEALREEARAMVGTRLELAAQAAAELQPARDLQWCLDVAADAVPALEAYSPPVYQELQGIAEATGLSLPELVIGNGWTDVRDLLKARGASHNCTSIAAGAPLTADGHTLVAQTWDMNHSAAPYLVVVRRRPDDGPRTLSLTTAGCLSLIGMNEDGLAIGNTNLTPTDARPGVFYLALIHEALRQRTLDRAVAAITEACRMSGHYYYLADAADQFVGLETMATRYAVMSLTDGRICHTNHYLDQAQVASGMTTAPGASSLSRQERGSELLAGLRGDVDDTSLSQVLSDHRGENCICRHVHEDTPWASLAAVVMEPATREVWVWDGPPCEGDVQCLEP